MNKSKGQVEDDVDALFRLPLTEFIGARKTLAARLKQQGHGDQANRVKALVKPSISAWAVNQLYWQHREAFDHLIETGEEFRRAQSSRVAGKIGDMREALDARREALSNLSLLAAKVLRDVGHNPTPDMVRRVTTTLEAMSAYASLPGDLAPGRLTQDVDPPGFDSLASFVPGAAMPARTKEPARVIPFRKDTADKNALPRKAVPSHRQIEKTRQAKVAAAKASLEEAKRALIKARARAQSAEASQKKAKAEAKQKEKQRRDAEERFEKAKAASDTAARRAQSLAAEAEEAARVLRDAEETLEVASKEVRKTDL